MLFETDRAGVSPSSSFPSSSSSSSSSDVPEVLSSVLARHGETPIPPYLERDAVPSDTEQ